MPRLTPLKDFLFRLQVDSDFVNRVLDPDPEQRNDAFAEYGLDDATRTAIDRRPTPLKDFLFRLEVDSDFVNRVLDPGQRVDALAEFELDGDARAAIESAIESADFRQLQSLVQAEDTDTETVHILPRGWVR
jgi:hypothetical protein